MKLAICTTAAAEMAGIYESMLSRARLSVVRRDGCLRAERLP